MRLGAFWLSWNCELIADFDNDSEMAHDILCDHNNGICLDEIVEPEETISYVIDYGGTIISDDDSELHSLAAIMSELDSFPNWR